MTLPASHAAATRPAYAMHLPMPQDGLHMAQLRYDYSDQTLAQLRREATLPARLQNAVPRRQMDYLAGRCCALQALRAADVVGTTDIPIGERGQPVWPAGMRGSISHCDGIAVAAVGRADQLAYVGIDIEREISVEVSREIGGQLATAEEMQLGPPQGCTPEAWLTLLFSGKESLFKALYPSVGAYFDFLDASATQLDLRAGMFTLRLQVTLSPQHTQGSTYAIRFHRQDGHVLTQCVLPA